MNKKFVYEVGNNKKLDFYNSTWDKVAEICKQGA